MREKFSELGNAFVSFIDMTLSTDVTPLAYLVTIHSMLFGAAFLFLGSTSSVSASILYQIGVLLGGQFWGALVLVACVVLITGMYLQKTNLVGAASFAMFLLWTFAVIAYFASGFWFQGILGFFTMNYFGYINLAAFLGRLWNYTPDRG